MERHEVTSPLWGCVVSLAKNVSSIEMGERLAADSPRRTGNRSSRENPHAMKSVIDHKSDCAPVSAIAETSAKVFEVRLGVLYLVWAEVSMEVVIGTLGWSLRRARFHSPLVKM